MCVDNRLHAYPPGLLEWRSTWSDMFHRDDDMALFLPGVDIPMGFGNLFQWIASIDDRAELSRLNQLCEELSVFRVFAGCPCCPGYDGLAAAPRNPPPAKLL